MIVTKRYQYTVKDTFAVLAAANRVYAIGTLIIESDTEPQRAKESNGRTRYLDLPYLGEVQAGVTVNNTLTSTSTTNALSANMGRVVNQKAEAAQAKADEVADKVIILKGGSEETIATLATKTTMINGGYF